MLTLNLQNKTTQQKRLRVPTLSLVTFTSILLLSHFMPIASYAAVSSNSDYSIELDEISADNPEPTKKPDLPFTEILLNNSAFNTSNYTISSTSDAFSFDLSQLTIDFGALSATNPVIRTSELLLSSPLQGAQVFVNENHPMTSRDKQVIPDTTCDKGSCTQGFSTPWISSLTYGFGYRCESEANHVCDRRFAPPNTFKQFADATANESLHPIILTQQSKRTTKAKIIYKVNISGTQPQGGYSNTITYIAIPNF